MDHQLYFIRGRNDRVPVKFEIFKHGGGIYLAIGNRAEALHLALVGPTAAMVVELRLAADLIEAAAVKKDQGHITRGEIKPPVLADLTGDPRHDFPIFVRRFARSSPDVVAAIAQLYQKQGYKVPGMEAILQGYDDLEVIWPARHKILSPRNEPLYGARNRIAKALGIKDAGNWRQRIDTALWLLKQTPADLLELSEAALEVSGADRPDSNTPAKSKKATNG